MYNFNTPTLKITESPWVQWLTSCAAITAASAGLWLLKKVYSLPVDSNQPRIKILTASKDYVITEEICLSSRLIRKTARHSQAKEWLDVEKTMLQQAVGKHVVRLYDSDSQSLLLENAGTTLESCKLEQSPEGETLFKSICSQLLTALVQLRRQQVWHLDIKPDNIAIDSHDKLRLLDFELAASRGKLDRMEYGAPRYKAPEAFHSISGSVSHKTDVFGAALVLYELLAQQPLLEDIPREKVFKTSHSFGKYLGRKITKLKAAGVNNDLCELLRSMLNWNPRKRPSAAAALVLANRFCRSDSPIFKKLQSSRN